MGASVSRELEGGLHNARLKAERADAERVEPLSVNNILFQDEKVSALFFWNILSDSHSSWNVLRPLGKAFLPLQKPRSVVVVRARKRPSPNRRLQRQSIFRTIERTVSLRGRLHLQGFSRTTRCSNSATKMTHLPKFTICSVPSIKVIRWIRSNEGSWRLWSVDSKRSYAFTFIGTLSTILLLRYASPD